MNGSTRWQWPEARPVLQGSLAVGALGAVVCAVGAIWRPEQFFHSYLLAFLTWLALGLGSLALLMLHYVTGGHWGFVLRRLLEAATRTLPLLALLFVPLLFDLSQNYPWAHHTEDGHDHGERGHYLNAPFFIGRAVVYFAVWLTLTWLLDRCSTAHDRTGEAAHLQRAQTISGPGLVLYGLTVTFAGIDWVMSLDPHWFSTIFGAVVATAQLLPALALGIAAATFLARREPLAGQVNATVWNDLGNLLLAFVMLWTYMAFSQFLVIWSGNLPEEISWYEARGEGGWQWVAVVLAAGNFVTPFLLLLSRDLKRDPARLRLVALAVVAMSVVYQFWLVAPAFSPKWFWLDWMDVAALAGVGGLWLAFFLWQIQARPMVPVHRDAPAEEALHHA